MQCPLAQCNPTDLASRVWVFFVALDCCSLCHCQTDSVHKHSKVWMLEHVQCSRVAQCEQHAVFATSTFCCALSGQLSKEQSMSATVLTLQTLSALTSLFVINCHLFVPPAAPPCFSCKKPLPDVHHVLTLCVTVMECHGVVVQLMRNLWNDCEIGHQLFFG